MNKIFKKKKIIFKSYFTPFNFKKNNWQMLRITKQISHFTRVNLNSNKALKNLRTNSSFAKNKNNERSSRKSLSKVTLAAIILPASLFAYYRVILDTHEQRKVKVNVQSFIRAIK
jgi:hypothetical protein